MSQKLLSHLILYLLVPYAGDSTDLVRYSVVRKLVNSWVGNEGDSLIGFDPYFLDYLDAKEENTKSNGMAKRTALKGRHGLLQEAEGSEDSNESKDESGISDRRNVSQRQDKNITQQDDDDDDDDNDDDNDGEDDDAANPLLPGPKLTPAIESILSNMNESQRRIWEKIVKLVNYAGDSLREVVDERKKSNGLQSSSSDITSSADLSSSSVPVLTSPSSTPIIKLSSTSSSSSSSRSDLLQPSISTSLSSEKKSSSKIPLNPSSTSIPTAASTSSATLQSKNIINRTESSKSRFDFSVKKRNDSDIPVCYPILWPEKRNSGK